MFSHPSLDAMDMGPTILVIDDDRSILELLRHVLAGLAARVVTATNGLSGIRIFKARRPDLVLTDLMMPGASGLEVVQTIRSFDTQIPVVLMSGHADYMTTLAEQYGFTAVLRKPMHLDKLEAVLKPLLHRTVEPNTAAPEAGQAACQA
jgi:DNA-binding NtrC family response regulator